MFDDGSARHLTIQAEQPPHRHGLISAEPCSDGNVWIEFVHTRNNGESYGTDHIVVDPAGALELARELIAASEKTRAIQRDIAEMWARGELPAVGDYR